MIKRITPLLFLLLAACTSKVDKIKPVRKSISESIYASGIVKSRNQYQVYANVSGIINQLYATKGDTLKKGDPILSITNEAQKLNKENAALQAEYSDIRANQGKLDEAEQNAELAFNKMKNDSMLLTRQQALWNQKVGTAVELEQRQLAFQNSKTLYYSSLVKLRDLRRQLELNSNQAQKNLAISGTVEKDYTLRSEMNGVLYDLTKSVGEIVNPQTPVGVIGEAANFFLEMQVDENDIIRIQTGQKVVVALDSYKDRVFEAVVTKINPFMNGSTKTFIVEAAFREAPPVLYPNLTFEANIILNTKNNALLIPRTFMIGDTAVVKENGDTVVVKTGLKDYSMVEILSGLTIESVLIKAKQ